jgi:tetratricopeptide (TPR) repeat protein
MNNCGPTNLTINLNYYGSGVTQQEIASVVKPHYDDRNVSPDELVGYANEFTPLRASLFFGGDLPLLKELLAAGFPVVIEKGYEPDWQGWMGHYLTLFGYDDGEESFLAMDTFLGPWDSSGRDYSYEEIRENWQHFNNAFFVVYPVEREEDFLQIIDPELADPLAMWQGAAEDAQRAVDSDPENAFAWFNLGSSYTSLGDLTRDYQYYEAAAAAFDQARLIGLPPRMLWYQFKLYEAYLAVGRFDDVLTLTATIRDHQGGDKVEETFYYRGLALQDYGNEEDAAYNFRRALEIKPGYTVAENALDRLAQN